MCAGARSRIIASMLPILIIAAAGMLIPSAALSAADRRARPRV
jgi:hypothetical protein